MFNILTNIRPPQHAVRCKGTFKNFNTIEDFRAADKAALFNQVADEVRHLVCAHIIRETCRLGTALLVESLIKWQFLIDMNRGTSKLLLVSWSS